MLRRWLYRNPYGAGATSEETKPLLSTSQQQEDSKRSTGERSSAPPEVTSTQIQRKLQRTLARKKCWSHTAEFAEVVTNLNPPVSLIIAGLVAIIGGWFVVRNTNTVISSLVLDLVNTNLQPLWSEIQGYHVDAIGDKEYQDLPGYCTRIYTYADSDSLFENPFCAPMLREMDQFINCSPSFWDRFLRFLLGNINSFEIELSHEAQLDCHVKVLVRQLRYVPDYCDHTYIFPSFGDSKIECERKIELLSYQCSQLAAEVDSLRLYEQIIAIAIWSGKVGGATFLLYLLGKILANYANQSSALSDEERKQIRTLVSQSDNLSDLGFELSESMLISSVQRRYERVLFFISKMRGYEAYKEGVEGRLLYAIPGRQLPVVLVTIINEYVCYLQKPSNYLEKDDNLSKDIWRREITLFFEAAKNGEKYKGSLAKEEKSTEESSRCVKGGAGP